MELISILASIVSVIIGCFAIWLSITFYKMSVTTSRETTEAAKEISAGVRRLEELFNKLYSDTFGMMKDTVTDMRRHLWPDLLKKEDNALSKETDFAKDLMENINKSLSEKIDGELKQSLFKFLEELNIPKEKSKTVEKAISDQLQKTLLDSQERIEKLQSENVKRFVLNAIGEKGVMAGSLLRDIDKYGFPIPYFFRELNSLKKQGLISWEGEALRPNTLITRAY